MEELKNLAAHSLDKYFNILRKLGNVDNADVDNLIALLAINNMLEKFSDHLTDDDLKSMVKAIYCISGNCLIDFPKTSLSASLFNDIKIELEARISENNIIRFSTEDIIRIKQ